MQIKCYNNRMKRRGFTLVEAIMVIMIVGILAAVVSVDFISSFSTSKIEAARFKLKSDIIYAQELSVTQQLNHGVIFDPAGETYSVYKQTTGNIINNPLTGAPFTVNFNTDPDLTGIDLVSANFGAPTTNRVEFDNYGAPSDGTTVLAANGSVSLSYSGLNGTVTVTKNTGMAN